MSLTDMASRSHRGAMGLHSVLTQIIRPALMDTIEALDILKAVMGATREFGKGSREDVREAISECRNLQVTLAPKLEQVLTVLDIVIHATGEAGGLSQQAGEQLRAAEGHLAEAEEESAAHISLTANLATVTGELDILYSDPVRLKRVLALADEKAVKAILEGMGYEVRLKDISERASEE